MKDSRSIIQLPPTDTLGIPEDSFLALSHCFDNTTQSYKYYWLMALIQQVAVNQELDFPAIDLTVLMTSMAWFPLRKQRIDLGISDGFSKVLDEMNNHLSLKPESTMEDVMLSMHEVMAQPSSRPAITRLLKNLLNNVPYCFLNPWTHLSGPQCMAAAQSADKGIFANCPYTLSFRGYGRDRVLWVHVHEEWARYICRHASALYDYALTALCGYAQRKNSHLLAAQYKLDWRIDNSVHQRQLFFWNKAIIGTSRQGNPLKCLFTLQDLQPLNYRIEHFLPATYRESQCVWSTFPAMTKAEICATGNRFREIGQYVTALAHGHQQALRGYLAAQGSVDLVAPDYAGWLYSVTELANMPTADFVQAYRSHLTSSMANESNRITGFSHTAPLHIDDDNSLSINIHTTDMMLNTNNVNVEHDYIENQHIHNK